MLIKTDRSDVEGGGGNSKKLFRTTLKNTANKVDFYFKLFKARVTMDG